MAQPHSKILFKETQRFTQWWIWAINLGILVIPLIRVYQQFTRGKMFEDKPMSYSGLLVSTCLIVLLVVSFRIMNLKTEITNERIYFDFFPFHTKKYFYDLTEIQSMKVVKYSPIFDYGGWGVRGFGSNKAFSVKGNKGLKIMFKNGDIRLIGTQKPDELQKIISQIGF